MDSKEKNLKKNQNQSSENPNILKIKNNYYKLDQYEDNKVYLLYSENSDNIKIAYNEYNELYKYYKLISKKEFDEEKKKSYEKIDNLVRISGPVSIEYFLGRNKKIIIVSDFHYSKDDVCEDNSILISDYLQNLLESSLKTIDIFVESHLPQNLKDPNFEKIIHPESDFLLIMRNFLNRNYKKYENKRLHFSDIRKLIGSESYILYFIDEKSGNLKDFTNNEELINKFKSMEKHILNLESEIPRILGKQIIKITNKDLVFRLGNYTFERIKNLVKSLYSENLFEILKKSDKSNRNEIIFYIFLKYMNCYTVINDLYTVLRIIKLDEIKNCVIYTGAMHSDFLRELFRIIDIYSNYQFLNNLQYNKKNGFRCVEAFDFEKYFEEENLENLKELLEKLNLELARKREKNI